MTDSLPAHAVRAAVQRENFGWMVRDVVTDLRPQPDMAAWVDGRNDLAGFAWFGGAVLSWLDAMVPWHRIYPAPEAGRHDPGSHQELATIAVALASYVIIGDQDTASDFQMTAVKQLTSWLARTYERVAAPLDWYEFHWLRGQWFLSRPNNRVQQAVTVAVDAQRLLPSIPAATCIADASHALVCQLQAALTNDHRFEYRPSSTRWLATLLDEVRRAANAAEAPTPVAPETGLANQLMRTVPMVDPDDVLLSDYLAAVSSFAGFVEPFADADLTTYRRIYAHAVFPYANDPNDPNTLAAVRWEPPTHASGLSSLDRKIRDEIGEIADLAREWNAAQVQRFSHAFRIASLRTLYRNGWPSLPDIERLQERWDMLTSVMPLA